MRSAIDLFRSRWWSIGWGVAGVAFALHVAALSLAPISIGQAVLAGSSRDHHAGLRADLYVTPDVEQRAFRWVTPGAFVGVLIWLVASVGFSAYISQVANVGALFGAFAGAIVLVGWLWLANVALLFGAELDAEIERQKELGKGVPERETPNLPTKGR